MFGRKIFLEVTPVLAGGRASESTVSKPDATGGRQLLSEKPVNLIYAGCGVTSNAPKYDSVAQALGPSMTNWGVNDTDIILCKRANAADILPGKIVTMSVNRKTVSNDWSCFRHVKSVEGTKIVVETTVSGEIITDERDISDVRSVAIYKMKAPSSRPVMAR